MPHLKPWKRLLECFSRPHAPSNVFEVLIHREAPRKLAVLVYPSGASWPKAIKPPKAGFAAAVIPVPPVDDPDSTFRYPASVTSRFFAVMFLRAPVRLDHVAHEAVHAAQAFATMHPSVRFVASDTFAPTEAHAHPAGVITEAVWHTLELDSLTDRRAALGPFPVSSPFDPTTV